MLRVNGKPITREAIALEFNRLIAFYREHQPQVDLAAAQPELMRKAREQAIGSVLLMEEALRREIKVPPEKVEAKFRQMIESSGGKEAFMRMVERKSLDLEVLRSALTSGLQIDQLVREITSGVPKASEDEIRAYYDAHRDSFMMPEKIRTRHILLTYDDSQAGEREVAETRLKGFADAVRQGADFSELAKFHSECPSGKQAGGMIGWIGRGAVLPSLEQAVFGLRENGEVSEPVETTLGLHLLQRVDHKPTRRATYEEAHDRIAEILKHNRSGKKLTEFVAGLRQVADIENDETTPDDTEDDEFGFDFSPQES